MRASVDAQIRSGGDFVRRAANPVLGEEGKSSGAKCHHHPLGHRVGIRIRGPDTETGAKGFSEKVGSNEGKATVIEFDEAVFRQKTDSELERLLRQFDDLVDDAQRCLMSELTARGRSEQFLSQVVEAARKRRIQLSGRRGSRLAADSGGRQHSAYKGHASRHTISGNGPCVLRFVQCRIQQGIRLSGILVIIYLTHANIWRMPFLYEAATNLTRSHRLLLRSATSF
jgi:hypothetical protein